MAPSSFGTSTDSPRRRCPDAISSRYLPWRRHLVAIKQPLRDAVVVWRFDHFPVALVSNRGGCRGAMGRRRRAGRSKRHGTTTGPRATESQQDVRCITYLQQISLQSCFPPHLPATWQMARLRHSVAINLNITPFLQKFRNFCDLMI